MDHVFTYDLNFSEIRLDRNRLAEVLGYRKEVPGPVMEGIDFILSEIGIILDIRAGFRIFYPESVSIGKNVEIEGCNFDVKKIIASRLKKSEGMIIFAVTAGKGISDWSKKLMDSGEMLNGYIADAAGSEIVERAADILENILERKILDKGIKITNRYSPGYCGWDVSEQQLLFSLLPKEFLGITLSPGSLMVPIKSVSGFIGIGKQAAKEDYECSMCEIENCIRKRL